MKFSFIIPAYNCVDLACSTVEALKLVKTSKNFNFEVIFVDDGSSDCTGEYFQNKNYPFDFNYHYLERCDISSRSRARNFGIHASSGDYVIFIDADTVVKPDYLLELYRYTKAFPESVIVGQRLFLDHTISLSQARDQHFYIPYQISTCSPNYSEFRHIVFHELSYNMNCLDYPFLFGQTCNIAYSRKDLLAVNGFDETMIAWGIEDIELAYRIFQLGRSFLINPRMYVLHQFHGNQEEISVEDEKAEGIRKNTDIFYSKHPEALPLSNEDAYELFMSLATRFYDVEKYTYDDCPTITIQLKALEKLEKVKSQILKYSEMKNVRLVVCDYLEDCGLDLWVQQLGKRASTPRYYPISLYRYFQKSNLKKNTFEDKIILAV